MTTPSQTSFFDQLADESSQSANKDLDLQPEKKPLEKGHAKSVKKKPQSKSLMRQTTKRSRASATMGSQKEPGETSPEAAAETGGTAFPIDRKQTAAVSQAVAKRPSDSQQREATASPTHGAAAQNIKSSEEEVEGSTPASRVFSVSELNFQIKSLIEDRFPLVWVQGEVSNFKAHSSGHFYFSLKDKKCQISAVMFRGYNRQLKYRPENGMEVIVRGRVTAYPPRGQYQINCESLEPVGAGALQKAFEQLKAKLQAEGLFEAARKRAIPRHPRHVAVITSPTGAAIRDILNVLGRRHKGIRVTVIPAVVQGEAAPASIRQALSYLPALKDVDVAIVGRGGGSMEDLWGFNDEGVARALVSCSVPVISAVGHEVDFTIADFVADLRAPTPSAAAELVAKSANEIEQQLASCHRQLLQYMTHQQRVLGERIQQLMKRLVDPRRRLEDLHLRRDDLHERLELCALRGLKRRQDEVKSLFRNLRSPLQKVVELEKQNKYCRQSLHRAMANHLASSRQHLQGCQSMLDSLSPLRVVERGYAVVFDDSNNIVTDAAKVEAGDRYQVQLAKGQLQVKVESAESLGRWQQLRKKTEG